MIQTPLELDQDPEPDIRRLPSSQLQQTDTNSPSDPSDTLSTDTHATKINHGDPNTRFNHSQGGSGGKMYDEKSTEYILNPSVSNIDDNEKPATADLASGPDVSVSRPTSNRPKVRDFAVANIAQPIRRATEKLVPAKRDGPPVAFALPPNRPGTPNSANEMRRERAKVPAPGFKQSLIVRRSLY